MKVPVLAAAALVTVAAALSATAAESAQTKAAAPKLLLASATKLDTKAGTVTLPAFRGRSSRGEVWYVVTESSNRADAAKRGVIFAPKLRNALGTKAVQKATLAGDRLGFAGTVNFAPKTVIVPGDQGFPPAKVAPGAIGDARYSPLVTTGNGIVLNAPQVANASGRSDGVVSLDRTKQLVTLKTLSGFFGGQTVHYLRTDASVDVVAALEGSTLARNLDFAPGAGSNGPRSARSAIIPIVNGPRGKANAQRQGLQSAVLGEGSPLNITQSIPGTPDYSPIWDVHPAVWSESATPRRLTSSAQVAAAVKAGQLGSGGAGPANASLGGLKAAPFISNCPAVAIG
ncbi:MAG: hypothetical protein MSC30_20040 [Gaiellaceae bacterium MAG52_C11]|nr:hypothetical protein [Candidatus Gaiellasilicea maunaloa]